MNAIDIDAAKRDVAEAKKILQIAEARIARLEYEESKALLAEAEREARSSPIWETARQIKMLRPDLTMRECVREAAEGALALIKPSHCLELGESSKHMDKRG